MSTQSRPFSHVRSVPTPAPNWPPRSRPPSLPAQPVSLPTPRPPPISIRAPPKHIPAGDSAPRDSPGYSAPYLTALCQHAVFCVLVGMIVIFMSATNHAVKIKGSEDQQPLAMGAYVLLKVNMLFLLLLVIPTILNFDAHLPRDQFQRDAVWLFYGLVLFFVFGMIYILFYYLF